MKMRQPDILTDEDLRWAEIVRRSVDGLAAIAEGNAEGCDTEWMAMQYGLLSVCAIVDSIIKDYKQRIERTPDNA